MIFREKKFLLSQKRACGQFLHHCKYVSIVVSNSGDAHRLGAWRAGLGEGHYRKLQEQTFSNEYIF